MKYIVFVNSVSKRIEAVDEKAVLVTLSKQILNSGGYLEVIEKYAQGHNSHSLRRIFEKHGYKISVNLLSDLDDLL